MDLIEAVKQARAYSKTVDGRLRKAAKEATLAAVKAAAKVTPPVSEPTTATGNLKDLWAVDSQPEPEVTGIFGKTYKTELNNSALYASYVNDGHRMDRHFVPGLIKTPDGLKVEPDLIGKTGLMVGVRTQYVPGLHMTDAGQDAYDRTIDSMLENITEGL